MKPTDAMILYGTDKPIPDKRILRAGSISVTLEDGNLRDIRFDQVEMIRSISYLVRDRDWGTLIPQISHLNIEETDSHFRVTYKATFESGGARLDVDVTMEASDDQLVFSASSIPIGQFETNRTGFTVLHPVGVSGIPVKVEHSDGTTVKASFPDIIEPWQPFKEIQCLTHETSGVSVSCRMTGDIFEMEDQRNWSDASFKTYSRPLRLPWPYMLEDGVLMSQSVSLDFSGRSSKPSKTGEKILITTGAPLGYSFPETALVFTPDEAHDAFAHLSLLNELSPSRITCHYDPSASHTSEDLKYFRELQEAYPAVYDLEYAAKCVGDLQREFMLLAKNVDQSGLKLESMLVCPSVDRQSTPPGSDWPDCPPLDSIYAAAREFFGKIKIGGGMLSYFTELNRKRPPVENIDFISHGTNPIVHAADEQSVIQTLDTIPYILKSTKNFAEQLPYRLGLSSIPMRQNPYGSKTMDNSSHQRICMANSDPRHWARFGAAFAIGYAAAIAPYGIEVWTPAAFTGLRGVVTKEGRLSPLGMAISLLTRRRNISLNSCKISHPGKLAVISFDGDNIVSNLTSDTITFQINDREPISIEPFAIEVV